MSEEGIQIPPPSPRLQGMIERAITNVAWVELQKLPNIEQVLECRAREVAVAVIFERYGICSGVLDVAVESAVHQLRAMASEVVAERRES